MKNLILNFCGNEILIQYPKDFISLKKEIANKYQINLSDVLEMDIYFIKNEIKKVIKSEIDFKLFLHSRINTLFININESSSLFQKSLLDLQKKSKNDFNQLEILKKKKEENKKMQEKELEENKKKINELNNLIKDFDQKKLNYVQSIIKLNKSGKEKKISFNEKNIQQNEKEQKSLQLNKNINEHEKILFNKPINNVADIDKQIKEINKNCFQIIKNSQKKIIALKNEENNLIKEIISYEKKIGLFIDEKKPMKKYGFFFPNREHNQIKTLKFEDKNNILKIQNKKQEIIPPLMNKINEIKINKKIENVVKNLRKNIKQEVEKNISKTNKEIETIRNMILEKNLKIDTKDEEYLNKCEKENIKTIQEVDKWIEFILTYSHQMIETIGKQDEMNFKKLQEISKKITDLQNNSITEQKKLINSQIFCNNCKEAIVGFCYKCQICKEFYYCEKCEEKNNGRHEHSLIKINISDFACNDIK